MNKTEVYTDDLHDLIKLAQLLKNEEGRNDIDGIADTILEIVGDMIRGRPLGTIERMF